MTDLKDAILDAKYIDMVSLADFVVQDCGLPDYDDDGNPLPQQNEIAAAIFRWAARQNATPEPAVAADDDKRNWPNIGKLPEKDSGKGDE